MDVIQAIAIAASLLFVVTMIIVFAFVDARKRKYERRTKRLARMRAEQMKQRVRAPHQGGKV